MEGDRELDANSHGASHDEAFIQLLTKSQSSLRAYLMGLIGNYDAAEEVLQRTNVVLWENAGKYRREAAFMPWAVTLARFELMSYYRDRKRDRHIFSEELARLMAQTAEQEDFILSDRYAALRHCVALLPRTSRDILAMRYENHASFASIAERFERTENAIRAALVRIRKTLAVCVTKRLKLDSTG